MNRQRTSGILLHPTSLPSPWGIGDLGPGAHDFIDFLHDSGQAVWQMLPLGPTGYGDSPYQCLSAFAGNPLLISPDLQLRDGLLEKDDLAAPDFPVDHVDFGHVIPHKYTLLATAHARFLDHPVPAMEQRFESFCRQHAHWLEDFCLFAALKEHHQGKPWTEWPEELIRRDPEALAAWTEKLAPAIERHRFIQFLFSEQWKELREHAAENNIALMGDIPIFLAHDSADVWSLQQWFYLDKQGQPTVVAGVPPDYFSATGQRWGNPLFNWPRLKEDGYRFWIERFQLLADMFDLIRIDHFRGFASYWEIPAKEKTAVNGKWKKGPGADLFRAIEAAIGDQVPIIAEDLGIITEDVVELLDELGFPGMAVLQFGFGSAYNGSNTSSFMPHHHRYNQVVYTGTHDNDTVVGWWRQQPEEVKDYTRRYLNCDGSVIHRDMIRAALGSVAKLALFPLQDLLGLGNEARMNEPATASGNWQWRFAPQAQALAPDLADDLLGLTRLYGRTVEEEPDPEEEDEQTDNA
jgi:4-alpha-glucanotransferase